MSIGGVSIILILGIVNFALLTFQLITGLRYIRVKFVIHRNSGIALFCCAFVRGLLAILAT
jgi:hypothetical protein